MKECAIAVLLFALGATVVLGQRSGDSFGRLIKGNYAIGNIKMTGNLYIVNETTIQITDCVIPLEHERVPLGDKKVQFMALTNGTAFTGLTFERLPVIGNNGVKTADETIPADGKPRNLVIRFFENINLPKFDYVGPAYSELGNKQPVYIKVWKPAEAMSANKWRKPVERVLLSQSGMKTFWYNVSSGPIYALDEKTILITKLSFQGDKPPDGWVFAGRYNKDQFGREDRKVSKNGGKKLRIKERDSLSLSCSIRESWDGSVDRVVVLPPDMNVWNIDYCGVYCYDVGVDFGHVEIGRTRNGKRSRSWRNNPEAPLKPYIPDISDGPDGVSSLFVLPDYHQEENDQWKRPILIPPQHQELNVYLGPAGGERTKAMRKSCLPQDSVYYVNGVMSPEIWLVEGTNYKLKVYGGNEVNRFDFHPLYLTSESSGGWDKKPFDEQVTIQNYAGVPPEGRPIAGDLCVLEKRQPEVNPDGYDSAEAYVKEQVVSTRSCSGQLPGTFEINENTFWNKYKNKLSDVIYYQSRSEFYMGGPIRICKRISDKFGEKFCE